VCSLYSPVCQIKALYKPTLSTLLCDTAIVLLVMQVSDGINSLSWQQFGTVCEFCGDILRWSPSVSDQTDHQTDRQPDQLYVCSNCHKYADTFNSQLMSDDGGQVMDALITDADDSISPASASQDNMPSPR